MVKCDWCGETEESLKKDLENNETYIYTTEIVFFKLLTVDDETMDRGICCSNCLATWFIEDPSIDIMHVEKLEAT